MLERVRSSLADGDAPGARKIIDKLLAGTPSAQDQAKAELFLAESYLIEQQLDKALAGYRQVADAFPRFAEGEAAAFAAAQMLYERGSRSEAKEALRTYVARYPGGRFGREARDRLDELTAPAP